ncbi:glycosyltransferase family 2 protein [Bacillus sp. FJAT-27225]|uniref:glycosyltransferase family 2 protein n=1 Tax=Bacillus sp. FJAT-27225 TaxID=1743144 RepID=UPI000A7DB1D8|nr:glycosyltransferase family 2 protein [Bacillus sp. FJAT-27225]
MDLSIVEFVNYFNLTLFLLFTLLYSYHLVYMLVAFKAKKTSRRAVEDTHLHKFAVIIAARNEELVIGQLISSIKDQKYPEELLDIFVVADNCTDNTAQLARQAGAIVRERFNKVQVGKGYALDYMIKVIQSEYSANEYDGYFVFDADNLLSENYVAEMNKTFNEGYRIVTSYRNSKNFGQNWISSGYALWFLHEAEYLNLPRMVLNSSCAVSGTGFLVNAGLMKENGGWTYHLLTEDIEFSVAQILKGEKIGYCRDAIFFDEQPITFEQSWHQRMRWAKGFYQVFAKYGGKLISKVFQEKQNRLSYYDMAMTIMLVVVVTGFSILVNGFVYLATLLGLIEGNEIVETMTIQLLQSIGWSYGIIFVIGLITTITEWKKIHTPALKKIAYLFTFPIFMFTYIPISIVALFKDVEWKPIAHTVAKSIDEVR